MAYQPALLRISLSNAAEPLLVEPFDPGSSYPGVPAVAAALEPQPTPLIHLAHVPEQMRGERAARIAAHGRHVELHPGEGVGQLRELEHGLERDALSQSHGRAVASRLLKPRQDGLLVAVELLGHGFGQAVERAEVLPLPGEVDQRERRPVRRQDPAVPVEDLPARRRLVDELGAVAFRDARVVHVSDHLHVEQPDAQERRCAVERRPQQAEPVMTRRSGGHNIPPTLSLSASRTRSRRAVTPERAREHSGASSENPPLAAGEAVPLPAEAEQPEPMPELARAAADVP